MRTRPGITIPEIAEAMGIQQNYLYRVLPALQKDGLVRKEGRGWHPARRPEPRPELSSEPFIGYEPRALTPARHFGRSARRLTLHNAGEAAELPPDQMRPSPTASRSSLSSFTVASILRLGEVADLLALHDLVARRR